jgi:hypothetical protein
MGNRQSRRDTIVSEYQRRKRKAQKRSGSEPRAAAPRVAVAAGDEGLQWQPTNKSRRIGPTASAVGPKNCGWTIEIQPQRFRHGLSLTLSADPQTRAKIEALAEAVVGDTATAEQLGAARVFAAVHLELTRIRNACAQVTSKLSTQAIDPHSVRRLCGDRYERRAWIERKHAARELDHLREQLQ